MNKWITLSLLILTASMGFADRAPTKNFVWADTNRNGSITIEEFIAVRAVWAEQRGSQRDDAQAERIFLNKDRNKDGELSPEEFRLR
ncbi:MAG: hypothetical protein JEZ10_02850 [Verrucomicrobia bacterium]|nr:hypothetical protein [Verrucomicrobiota bacterium]